MSRRVAFNADGDCAVATVATADGSGGAAAVLTLSASRPPTVRAHTASVAAQAGAMLGRSNLVALLAGGSGRRRVQLWDARRSGVVAEAVLEYPVARVHLRRDVLVALTTHAVVLHALRAPDPPRLATHPATATLLAVSTSPERCVCATETPQRGFVQVLDLTPALHGEKTLPSTHVRLFRAHNGTVRALALSADGRWLATASDRGTLVRVWDADAAAMQAEFRRGADPATITSLAFSADAARLVVASDKGTVHVFRTGLSSGSGDALPNTNTRSHLAFLAPLLPTYFGSEWSFAHFRVPAADPAQASPAETPPSRSRVPSSSSSASLTSMTVAASPELALVAMPVSGADKVHVACPDDGRIWRFAYDPRRGGEGILDGAWRLTWPSDPDAAPVVEPL